MTVFQRAQQLWSILVIAAQCRRTLTYGMIAKAIGAPPVAVGGFLAPVQAYCMQRQLPALTSLVVDAESGVPGSGFIAAVDVPAAQANVFKFDWLEHGAPDADEFEQAVKALKRQ